MQAANVRNYNPYEHQLHTFTLGRAQRPRGLRRRSAAGRWLGLWVRIPPGTWMCVSWKYCVFSGRELCDELITRPDEAYRLWFA